MATATGSITDSTAQDDIPKNSHQPVNYSFPSAHLGLRKQYPVPSNLLSLASGNGYTTWLCTGLKGVGCGVTHGWTSSQVLATVLKSLLKSILVPGMSNGNPSCLHTTLASLVSQLPLHTVPHTPLMQISTLPSLEDRPPTSRRAPLLQSWVAVHSNNIKHGSSIATMNIPSKIFLQLESTTCTYRYNLSHLDETSDHCYIWCAKSHA